MISDSPRIQRPIATGSLHALAQSDAPTPAPKRISIVDKDQMVPTTRPPRVAFVIGINVERSVAD